MKSYICSFLLIYSNFFFYSLKAPNPSVKPDGNLDDAFSLSPTKRLQRKLSQEIEIYLSNSKSGQELESALEEEELNLRLELIEDLSNQKDLARVFQLIDFLNLRLDLKLSAQVGKKEISFQDVRDLSFSYALNQELQKLNYEIYAIMAIELAARRNFLALYSPSILILWQRNFEAFSGSEPFSEYLQAFKEKYGFEKTESFETVLNQRKYFQGDLRFVSDLIENDEFKKAFKESS